MDINGYMFYTMTQDKKSVYLSVRKVVPTLTSNER
jgi:hypothetical protein